MKQYLFREQHPQRTYKGHYSDYHKYKEHLASDFNHHCGYTHCTDRWFGGMRTFQIDHFKSHSKYPKLKTEYSNLVYCCSYVNRLKSDDDNAKHLDPCNEDYNIHFERNYDGRISGKTESGKFMVRKLSLNLCRYAIVWNIERLEKRIKLLKEKERKYPELKGVGDAMCRLYFDYTQHLFSLQ